MTDGDSGHGGERRSLIVLLVDDQAIVGAAIGGLLSTEADVEFHYCAQPLEAVDVANRLGPTVILQDLLMPDMDGFALLDAFRINAATARTPVIVLSGTLDEPARERAMTHGAVDYLVKLPAKNELLAVIRRHAAHRDIAEHQPQPPRRQPNDDATQRSSDETLDRTTLAAFREADPGGASGFVSGLIDQFLTDADQQVFDLKVAAERADYQVLGSASHSLKGAASTIGANKLATLCGQMERHAGRHVNAAVVTVLLSDIEQELLKLRDALGTHKEL